MNREAVNDYYLQRAIAMFERINGQPCLHLDTTTKKVHQSKRIYDLRVDEGVIWGYCDWIQPPEERPDSLTDGLAIGADLLDVGADWWLDLYFNWFFIFSIPLVERAMSHDHSWIEGFLATTVCNRTIPRPPPSTHSIDAMPMEEALRYYG